MRPGAVLGDAALMESVERQEMLRALFEDEEALRQFIACAVIEEIVAGGGELLRKGPNVGRRRAEAKGVAQGVQATIG